MNRKNFLKNCLALGISIPFSKALYDGMIMPSSNSKNTFTLDGVMGIDAHSHPYSLNSDPYIVGRIKHSGSTSTVKRMKEAYLVASVFAAVGDRFGSDAPSRSLFEDTIKQLNRIRHFEEKKMVRIIKTKSDLNFSGKNDELFGAIMAIEGGDAIENDLQNINKFHDYGVRLITVLHKHDNKIGFNQESKSDGSISSFGIKVIERMSELGIIIDVAHSAPKTLKSISEVCHWPLLDSHTAPFPDGEENNFPNRARSWEEMEWIAKSGGLICTMPIGYTLGHYSRMTLTSWANEIALMKKRLGIEHVGLGTDSGGLPMVVNGWKSISSLPSLLNELKNVGLSQDDIIAFAGGNFLRIANNYLS
jgi:microsomal dipeptidase-like Zn-dependent dipeptidase